MRIDMKRIFAMLLLLLLPASLFAQTDVWFTGSLDDARAKAAAENKLVLIDFSSDG